MTVSVTSKRIQTVAGMGEAGYSGDGGPAVAACLNEPKNLALDETGNLYIADSENHAIRKVEKATGRITTIAGMRRESSGSNCQAARMDVSNAGEEDPFADPAVGRSRGFTQLADLSGTIRYVTGNSAGVDRFKGDGEPATEAALNFPTAVTVDKQGNVFVADTMNHRVRRIDGSTGIITTVAGTGQARFTGDGGPAESAALHEPAALAVDRQGRLYIADQSNNRVRMVELATGVICTIAGNGSATYDGDGLPAVEAGLGGPSGLAFGPGGELYIADTFNSRIRMVDMKTGLISTVVGNGGEYRYHDQGDAPSNQVSRPYGIAVDRDGNLYITDSDSHLLRCWSPMEQIIRRVVGIGRSGFGGDGGPAEDASLNYPFGVVIDREGTIFVADTFNHRIRKIAT